MGDRFADEIEEGEEGTPDDGEEGRVCGENVMAGVGGAS